MLAAFGKELILEAGQEVEEGVSSNGEAGPSRGAPLNNASKDKVEENARAIPRKGSEVMEQQGAKKMKEPFGKTIEPKDSLNPGVGNARESSLKIP